MASSSPRTWTYRVFTSFHGPDVRKNFLSHLRKQFDNNAISMFNDQRIERGQSLAPALTKAIRESRISIVVLSKNYASSSWCLDELLEILNCKREIGQKVMTVFYGVNPSDVREQSGDFGKAFKETCARKTEEKRRKWSQALNHVSKIAGEHLLNWDNESNMIEKLARDVSNKLNTTICKDFDGMVGIEAHLEKLQSLLHLDNKDEAMIVGIFGPAGIGKTTIARALHSRLSSSFQLTCFMDNLRGSYNNGLDEYGLKLCLQEKLLSKILNRNDMRVCHLDEIPARLCDQNVLIVLDDVDTLKQLEALANETNWFGPGSRIIVTTEDQDILEQHGIKNTYCVDFPTKEEAGKIFCRYAFRQSSAPDSFKKLVKRVTKLCGNLTLGLRVTGSYLHGKNEKEWEVILRRLENSLNQDIEGVLRVGYDSLHKNDQLLFLLIAFFFNYENDDHVMAMLAENNLDVKLGLKTLVRKSLVQISTKGNIAMHKLLQQMGRQAVERQEPWKRQILIDTNEICDVLKNASGSGNVAAISFDISTIKNVHISASAFKNMHNLRFLSIYKTRHDTNVRVHVSKNMDFPPRLRYLHWEVYPKKCLPCTFRPEHLVELNLEYNELHKLWEGKQPLTNLKKMNLSQSWGLKELPDLSNAINLERLVLRHCYSLVEIPSSIENLHKLEWLETDYCVHLTLVPTRINLASLKVVRMRGCRQLRSFPDISTNITTLFIADTMLVEMPESTRLWSSLLNLSIYGSLSTEVPPKRTQGEDVERIPVWIKDLDRLKRLFIAGCPKLTSLPELPPSLTKLIVDTCESLKTLVSFPFESRIEHLSFANCFRLSRKARSVITQQSLKACLPGRQVPEDFDHRAKGNSLTIRSDFYRFRFCAVVPQMEAYDPNMFCRVRINGFPHTDRYMNMEFCGRIEKTHLFMYFFDFLDQHGWLEKDNEVTFEFITTSHEVEIAECGVQILKGSSSQRRSYESIPEQVSEDDNEILSVGSSESVSEQVSEDDNENLPDGTTSESCSEKVSDKIDDFCSGFFKKGDGDDAPPILTMAWLLFIQLGLFFFMGFLYTLITIIGSIPLFLLRTVGRILLFLLGSLIHLGGFTLDKIRKFPMWTTRQVTKQTKKKKRKKEKRLMRRRDENGVKL